MRPQVATKTEKRIQCQERRAPPHRGNEMQFLIKGQIASLGHHGVSKGNEMLMQRLPRPSSRAINVLCLLKVFLIKRFSKIRSCLYSSWGWEFVLRGNVYGRNDILSFTKTENIQSLYFKYYTFGGLQLK